MPAITVSVRRFEYETLKASLKPECRIVILSCDSCAKWSDGLGGADGLDSLAEKLSRDGFRVVSCGLLPIACSAEHLQAHLDDGQNRKLLEEADVIIPLSCRKGIRQAEQALPQLQVLQVTKTLGAGTSSTGADARLTEPLEGIEIEIDGAEGIPLAEAAKRLGLCGGSF